MRILAGLQFGGATLTPFDDLEPGRGSIGDVVWGPAELLRDLELGLGIGTDASPSALRVAIWAERMARTAPLGRFYTRSFEVDPAKSRASRCTLTIGFAPFPRAERIRAVAGRRSRGRADVP